MWKNWNLFRRRTEESTNVSENHDEESDGKENTAEISRRGLSDSRDASGNVAGINNVRTNGDFGFNNYGNRQSNGHGSVDNNSVLEFSNEDDSVSELSEDGTLTTRHISPRKRSEIRMNESHSSQTVANLRRAPTTILSPFTQSEKPNLPRDSRLNINHDNMNKSFSGVYGPLLSTPIVPKVRRALESSGSVRSPQTPMLARNKQVGRSVSLNYGTANPTQSTAGHVPWVRLKRRESLTLSDLASGNTPQSPNTVKLAAPEPRLLPAAPSFRMTPVIVTTEHSRARVVDTQTVVSALREKRKRFGGNQRDDTFSEDSWINSAKRRRQDSSQSNASSVSIPSMPESLPNLMGTPGMSLLHIENLKDQRPSTVPAMDAFVSRHQREFGLGGDLMGHKPHQQAHSYQPQQLDDTDGRNKQQSGKSVLRSIQSSLSSSIRVRSNLSVLQQSGLDLNRIRQISEGRDTLPRIRSINSDISRLDQSAEEPQSKIARQTPVATIAVTAVSSSAEKSSTPSSADKSSGTVSSQTKQKIADGVVLRKHNLTSSNSLARPKQNLSFNALVSTNDFEQDRQKEYKRRVLDILDGDEATERPGVLGSTASGTVSTPMISIPAPTTSSSSVNVVASLAATSAAVSANLDSLNKLVQSAVPAMPSSISSSSTTSATSGITLSQLLKTSNGIPQSSTSSTPITSSKDVSSGTFITSSSLPQSTITEMSSPAVSSAAADGFKFGASLATTTPLMQTTSLPTAGGFHINFSTPASLSVNPSIATSSVAPSAFTVAAVSSQQTANPGFNFSMGTASTPNTSIVVSADGKSSFPGVIQTSSSISSDFGTTKGVDFLSSNPQLSDSSLNFKMSSATSAPSTGISGPPQGGSSIFSSGVLQGLAASSGSFSLSSTLQNFAAAQSENGPNTRQGISSTPSPGLLFSPTSSTAATTAASTLASGLFSFGPTSSTAAPSLGFNFGSAGSTAVPASIFTTLSSSVAPSAGNSTSKQVGFNFGSMDSVNTTSSQQPGGMTFGMMSTNPSSGMATPSPWPASTSSLAAGGFPGQSANSVLKGFGSNTQTSSTLSFPASGPQAQSIFSPATTSDSIPSLFGTTAPSFATHSQTQQPMQQPFGSTTAPTMFSSFSTAPTTTSTTAANNFTFGQTSANSGSSMPFTFGAPATQPGATNSFGGAVGGVTSTTSSSIFGSLLSPPQPVGATSVFGSGPTSTFGSSQFGASVPTTSPPAFGNSSLNSQFGSSLPTTSASAFGSSSLNSQFGSSLPTTSASAFGNSSLNSQFGSSLPTTSAPAFGNSSLNSQFGSSLPTTSAPAFGNNTVSSPFGSSLPTTSAPAFGNNSVSSQFGVSVPTTNPPAFGSAATLSVFGAMNNQASSVFGNAAVPGGQSSSIFGAPVSSSSNQPFAFGAVSGMQSATQQPPTFGSNLATAFGSVSGQQSNPQAPTFGSGQQPTQQQVSTFGTNAGNTFGNASAAVGSSLFGAKSVASAFGVGTANPGTMFGTSTQSSSAATPFGSSFGASTTFGSQQNPEKSAFGATAFGAPTQPTFGATNQSSVFGSASQNPPQNIFGSTSQNPAPAFGSQGSLQQTASSSPFGGGGGAVSNSANFFGTAKPNVFGATSTTQPGFNFGTTQPSAFNAQTASSGFNFGQPGTQPTASAANMGQNFSIQTPTRPPPFQAATPSGFNFAAAAGTTPTFNFSGTPSTPNPFNPQTPNVAPRPRATIRRPVRRGGPRR